MKYFVNDIRQATGMSQSEFAKRFHIPLSTLRKWEQLESEPPKYVLDWLVLQVPQYHPEYEKLVYDENECFFLDRENKRVFDRKGYFLPFTESLVGVKKVNLPFYFHNAFEEYYKVLKHLDRELGFDKKEDIIWR